MSTGNSLKIQKGSDVKKIPCNYRIQGFVKILDDIPVDVLRKEEGKRKHSKRRR
jgi:hypothetical protein